MPSAPRKNVLVWGDPQAIIHRLCDHLAELGWEARRAGSEAAVEPARSGEAWVYVAAGGGETPDLPDLEEAGALLDGWRASGGPPLVVIASAAIWEPNWHHPGLVEETAPRTVRTGNSIAARWRELEGLIAVRADHATGPITVLRAAPVPVRGGRDFWSRLLRRRVAFTVLGHNPLVQILTPEKLAEAVASALDGSVSGVLHVAPEGAVPLRELLRSTRVRRIPMPWWLHRVARSALARLGLAASAEQVAYLRYSFTVSADRMRRASGSRAGAMGDSRASDPFGMDRDYIDSLGRTLFRFLERWYWRIESTGLEHVPREGPVVLAGLHRGFMPFDAIMALHLLATRTSRYPRFLIHPGLVKFPFLHDFFPRLGGVLANRENGRRLLDNGEILAVLPEGVHGPFRLYRDSYRSDRYWRADFVRLALHHGAPILPWVTVGSAEALPILARIDWRWWRSWTEWPFLPVTPTLVPVPLPSKWHTVILPPLLLAESYPVEAAEDHEIVAEISRKVRGQLSAAMLDIVDRRPSAFHGSVF